MLQWFDLSLQTRAPLVGPSNIRLYGSNKPKYREASVLAETLVLAKHFQSRGCARSCSVMICTDTHHLHRTSGALSSRRSSSTTSTAETGPRPGSRSCWTGCVHEYTRGCVGMGGRT